MQATLESKAEAGDVHSLLNKFVAEQTAKTFELRAELFKKLTDVQSLLAQGVGSKVGVEEFNEALAQKADLTTFRTLMEQKACYADLEAQQRFLEKLVRELEGKASLKEFDQHVGFTRAAVDDLQRDLLLRATIKDVCVLLDQKANVQDVNDTLGLVQREVQRKAPEEALAKALND